MGRLCIGLIGEEILVLYNLFTESLSFKQFNQSIDSVVGID
jgi:hypothetical protein